jgi:hypothetical protein
MEQIRPVLLNPQYQHGPSADPNGILDSPLPCLLRRVTLWNDYFLRFSARACLPAEVYARMRRQVEQVPAEGPDFVLPWLGDVVGDEEVGGGALRDKAMRLEAWRRAAMNQLESAVRDVEGGELPEESRQMVVDLLKGQLDALRRIGDRQQGRSCPSSPERPRVAVDASAEDR